MEELDRIPDFGWRRRCDQDFEDNRDQDLRPNMAQVAHLAPLGIRYLFKEWLPKILSGKKPAIDQFLMRTSQKGYGAPSGGIGSGTIGRGIGGEFTRFQIVPGVSVKTHILISMIINEPFDSF